jgi:hypothetical protein
MGKLVQVATNTVTSAVSTVTLTGINTDDVYMVAVNNLGSSNDNINLIPKFTVGGTAYTGNYDKAFKLLRSTTTFANLSGTGEGSMNTQTYTGTGTSETANLIMYIYNANNSSEYTFLTIESSSLAHSPELVGATGGFVNDVTQAVDGIQFLFATGNITSGTFTLYRVV